MLLFPVCLHAVSSGGPDMLNLISCSRRSLVYSWGRLSWAATGSGLCHWEWSASLPPCRRANGHAFYYYQHHWPPVGCLIELDRKNRDWNKGSCGLRWGDDELPSTSGIKIHFSSRQVPAAAVFPTSETESRWVSQDVIAFDSFKPKHLLDSHLSLPLLSAQSAAWATAWR